MERMCACFVCGTPPAASSMTASYSLAGEGSIGARATRLLLPMETDPSACRTIEKMEKRIHLHAGRSERWRNGSTSMQKDRKDEETDPPACRRIGKMEKRIHLHAEGSERWRNG